ncbi:hypothetical protein [Armatimonas sp.]|uniref:hypothetical protein n=1 Tax=Armatimonas sp. TaxID=1872638 RepID=UPI00286B84E4|nr:hypothetical protein [Armatimonas sp.]
MTEPTDPIEGFLRQSLATETAPTLSPNFQQQLGARLQPRRIRKKQRRFLLAYSAIGFLLSLGTLQLAGFSIGLTLLCVLAPLAIIIVALRPHFRSLL